MGNLIQKLVRIANILDDNKKYAEADVVNDVLVRLGQYHDRWQNEIPKERYEEQQRINQFFNNAKAQQEAAFKPLPNPQYRPTPAAMAAQKLINNNQLLPGKPGQSFDDWLKELDIPGGNIPEWLLSYYDPDRYPFPISQISQIPARAVVGPVSKNIFQQYRMDPSNTIKNPRQLQKLQNHINSEFIKLNANLNTLFINRGSASIKEVWKKFKDDYLKNSQLSDYWKKYYADKSWQHLQQNR